MLDFTIKRYNKSIYFIKPNTQWLGPVGVLYEMLYTEIFSYNFSSNKILQKLIFVPLIISSK